MVLHVSGGAGPPPGMMQHVREGSRPPPRDDAVPSVAPPPGSDVRLLQQREKRRETQRRTELRVPRREGEDAKTEAMEGEGKPLRRRKGESPMPHADGRAPRPRRACGPAALFDFVFRILPCRLMRTVRLRTFFDSPDDRRKCSNACMRKR